MAVPKAGPKSRELTALPPRRAAVPWLEMVLGRRLYGWQAREIRKLHVSDRPRVSYGQIARKQGKTFFAGGLILAELCLKRDRHVYALSDSERNLNSVLFRELREMIDGSPHLRDSIHVYKNQIVVPETGSFIETRASNLQATQGINPHLAVVDEVHLQRGGEVWAGMQLAGSARRDGLLLGITSPGYDLNSLAHELYLRVADGDPDIHGFVFEARGDRDIDDVDGWREANPAHAEQPGWLEQMQRDRRLLPPHEFERFRLGRWVAAESSWLPYGAWEACDEADELEDGAAVVLGFDGSKSRDATALVAATVEAEPQVSVVAVWERPAHTHHDWQVPRDEVDHAIREACGRWDVRELVADPTLWVSELQAWARARLPVVEMPQTASRMVPATQRFYEAVIERAIRHDHHPVLRRHLANTILRPNGQVAKDHKDSPRKIDSAVAAIMAYDRACILGAKRRRRVYVV